MDRSRLHFGDRFDYSLFSELPVLGEKVPILCALHNAVFNQEPRNHMRGHFGCPQCKSLKLSGPIGSRGTHGDASTLTTEFVSRAREMHGERYDYSKFIYAGMSNKGVITCREHGEFLLAPHNHLSGKGCPRCARDKASANTFKHRCKELGINYWRALKRRGAGLPDEKVFEAEFVRSVRETTPITIDWITYPNMREAVRALNPPATAKTLSRWIRSGLSPEDAFRKVPNPGYANGIVYLVTHLATGTKYVGITIQMLERRWRSHIEQAQARHIKSDVSLHAAIRTDGEHAFTIEQLDSGQSKSTLEDKEREWIMRLNTLEPNGFNLSTGGTSGGSNPKPVIVDGLRFLSVGSAVTYISRTRGISLDAAQWRLLKNRLDARTPAPRGKSLIKTPAYKAWSNMVHCTANPKSKSYILGVTVIERWRDFSAFLEDVGQPPESGLVFARIDKSKGFSPENCAWMTRSTASKINASYMKKVGTLVGRRGSRGRAK